MKVKSEAPDLFKPVTITLESQDELDVLYLVSRRIGGQATADVFGNTSSLCNALLGAGATQEDDSKFVATNIGGGIYINYKEEL